MPGLALDNNAMTAFKSADYSKRVEECQKSSSEAFNGKTADERAAAAEQLATDLKAAGAATAAAELGLFQAITKSLGAKGKSGANERAGALTVLTKLCAVGPSIEPFLMEFIVPALDLIGDKSRFVSKAAETAVESIFDMCNANATYRLVPLLLKSVHSVPSNVKRLGLISHLCKHHQPQMTRCLGEAIPSVAEDLHDLKKEVATAAKAALHDLCGVCQNVDVLPLLDTMASALANHAEMPECVYKLASTTFVQEIESDTLSILNPILTRGLNDRSSKIIRACARIVENMAKLVEQPRDVAPFMPVLLPLLEKARDHVSDPEVRNVCDQACKVLVAKADTSTTFGLAEEDVLPTCRKMVTEVCGEAAMDSNAEKYLDYAALLAVSLNEARQLEMDLWNETLLPYLALFVTEEQAKQITEKIHGAVVTAANEKEDLEDADAEKLCDCDFSLAYGNKVLLKKTRLVLHRGRAYGLIGKNDSGKTSLMRAIAEYRVDGFPPQSVLKTMFVETDIPADDADFNIIDYIFQHPSLKDLDLDRQKVIDTLADVGFTEDSPAKPTSAVGELSGGWRMKLALARAMLLNADILLLDEPTNHLDAYNVKWVEDWLVECGKKGVTAIMVSHDSGLLDRVCHNIIQIENLKIHIHRGNLSAFVAKRPDCKSYFELKSDKYKFTFPQPGRLEGINSKGKAILKMTNITFTYPGAAKAQLNNVTVQCSLASRVACVGVNGAGKSTMIKLLTGELEPDKGSGDVWKHPNCRVGYIAQHAFHHIENHLDKTANEYICWRYRNGNDREELVKVTTKITPEDEKRMKEPVYVEFVNPATGEPAGSKRVVKTLTEGRRENKQKRDQEYEVELMDDKSKNSDVQYWVTRKVLIASGWEKVVNEIDGRIAMRAAMFACPLTQTNVKEHLSNVGLEEEFSTHMRMGALSGGQKVKVVLAAAMWNRPHILILDEPTNYLDRDSLGALAAAIREFEGGVVMITHNSQFCDDLCPEVWHLENNTLNRKGDASWMNQEKLEDVKQQLTTVDKFGNTIELKKTYTAKEQKKRDKLRKKINKQRKKDGLDPLDTDDDNF